MLEKESGWDKLEQAPLITMIYHLTLQRRLGKVQRPSVCKSNHFLRFFHVVCGLVTKGLTSLMIKVFNTWEKPNSSNLRPGCSLGERSPKVALPRIRRSTKTKGHENLSNRKGQEFGWHPVCVCQSKWFVVYNDPCWVNQVLQWPQYYNVTVASLGQVWHLWLHLLIHCMNGRIGK